MQLNYLNKFRSSIGSTQSKQLIALLNSKKTSGEISTIEEFKNKLKELTTTLLSQKIAPTLKFIQGIPGQEISSEEWNTMLIQIENDLTTAFTEANTLEEIIDVHHQLIEHISLLGLKLSFNKLENQVNLFEFLYNTSYGFDKAWFNTFRNTDATPTSRTDKKTSLLFQDPRTKDTIETDCFIDPIGERLILGKDKADYYTPQGARYLADNSTISEMSVIFKNSNINNILDGKNNTYWAVPILLSTPISTGATTGIEIDLGLIREINFIEIEPASFYPMYLTSIKSYDSNLVEQTLYSTETEIKTQIRISIDKIKTRFLKLFFRQDNFKETQFKYIQSDNNSIEEILDNTQFEYTPNINNISTNIQNTLTSSMLLDYLLPDQIPDYKKYYEYTFGFDNIRIGYDTYLDSSIYVSQKYTINNPGILALRTNEIRPYNTATSSIVYLNSYTYPTSSSDELAKNYFGSTEYYFAIELFDNTKTSLGIEYAPVFPIHAKKVYKEKLELTHKTDTTFTNNNAGVSQFYTNGSGLKVYKNNSELTLGSSPTGDYVLTTGSDSSDLFQDNPNFPMKSGIKLNTEPDITDIITVSYTPTPSSTFCKVKDNTALCKVVSYGKNQSILHITDKTTLDNLYYIDSKYNKKDVSYIELYIITIMKRISHTTVSLSPSMEDYLLLSAERNITKFIKD